MRCGLEGSGMWKSFIIFPRYPAVTTATSKSCTRSLHLKEIIIIFATKSLTIRHDGHSHSAFLSTRQGFDSTQGHITSNDPPKKSQKIHKIHVKPSAECLAADPKTAQDVSCLGKHPTHQNTPKHLTTEATQVAMSPPGRWCPESLLGRNPHRWHPSLTIPRDAEQKCLSFIKLNPWNPCSNWFLTRIMYHNGSGFHKPLHFQSISWSWQYMGEQRLWLLQKKLKKMYMKNAPWLRAYSGISIHLDLPSSWKQLLLHHFQQCTLPGLGWNACRAKRSYRSYMSHTGHNSSHHLSLSLSHMILHDPSIPRYSIGTQNANSSFDVQIGGSLLKKWCFPRIGKGKTIELDEFILRQRSRIWEADRQRCSIVECDGRIFDFLHLIQHLLLAGLAKKCLNSSWKLAVYFGHGSFRTERKGLFSDLSLSLCFQFSHHENCWAFWATIFGRSSCLLMNSKMCEISFCCAS